MFTKFIKIILLSILLLGVATYKVDTANAASKVMWGKTELKLGQIGKATILADTVLVKLESDGSLTTVRAMKKGEEYRVYSYKSNHGGLFGVGGGSYVQKNAKVKYETPSKSKLALLKQNPANVNKVYSTKEIVEINDEKIVLIETENNIGSGIVVGNGLILTNYHVMEGTTKAKITFNDGQQFEVEGIVDMDANKDIALLKTTKEFNTSGVTIRSSNKGLSKGEKVVAIGSPIGLQNTVSEGIISSFRTSSGVSLIQTTVDIDNGSSGGALFDTSGQLIGMTSSGIDSLSANLNFAIATQEFIPMVNKYISKNFNTIIADFPIATNPSNEIHKPVLGNIALGMTKEQVYTLSAGTYTGEEDNDLYYSDIKVLGQLADVIYQFKNNSLIAINVYHYSVDNVEHKDVLEEYFINMYKVISDSYGIADELDTDWLDDNDDFHLSAHWYGNEHDTMLTVVITMNSTSYGGIRINTVE